MPKKTDKFDKSKELKNFFTIQFEIWAKSNRAGLDELAKRCGVTQSYLSQVGRYGRIPSRPVLILLAYNFGLNNPAEIFQVSGLEESWPYPDILKLVEKKESDQPFVSVKVDFESLKHSIKEIIQNEIRPKSLGDILGNRPLRVGLNPLKFWLFKDNNAKSGEGLFIDFCNSLALSLRCKVEFKALDYSDYENEFKNDRLDIYGPIVTAPNLAQYTTFTRPLYRIGMSALARRTRNPELADLTLPKNIKDLLNKDYKITVIAHSRAHLLANTMFGRNDNELIISHSYDEAFDRVILRGIKKSAHIFICNSVDARISHRENKRETHLLFSEDKNMIDIADSGVAVKSNLPEMVGAINDLISFLSETGGLKELVSRWRPKGMEDVLF